MPARASQNRFSGNFKLFGKSERASNSPTFSHMFYDEETNLTNKYIGSVKNLLKNLTAKDKEFLKLPENFNEIFSSRILKLRMMNCVK